MQEAEGALQAMDAAWAGAAGPLEGDSGEGGASTPTARRQHAAASAARAPTSHPTHEAHPEHEGVNMEEALHSVEAGVSGAASVAAAAAAASPDGNGSGSRDEAGRRRPPVVADADRASFERIVSPLSFACCLEESGGAAVCAPVGGAH